MKNRGFFQPLRTPGIVRLASIEAIDDFPGKLGKPFLLGSSAFIIGFLPLEASKLEFAENRPFDLAHINTVVKPLSLEPYLGVKGWKLLSNEPQITVETPGLRKERNQIFNNGIKFSVVLSVVIELSLINDDLSC